MNVTTEQPAKRLTLLELAQHAAAERDRGNAEIRIALQAKEREASHAWILAKLRTLLPNDFALEHRIEVGDGIILDEIKFSRERKASPHLPDDGWQLIAEIEGCKATVIETLADIAAANVIDAEFTLTSVEEVAEELLKIVRQFLNAYEGTPCEESLLYIGAQQFLSAHGLMEEVPA